MSLLSFARIPFIGSTPLIDKRGSRQPTNTKMQPINLSSASQSKAFSAIANLTRHCDFDRDQLISAAICTAAICDPSHEADNNQSKVSEESLTESLTRWSKGNPARQELIENIEPEHLEASTFSQSQDFYSLLTEMSGFVSDHGYLPTLVSYVQLYLNSHDAPIGIEFTNQRRAGSSYFPKYLMSSALQLLNVKQGQTLKIHSYAAAEMLPSVIEALSLGVALDLDFPNSVEDARAWNFLNLFLTDSPSSLKFGLTEKVLSSVDLSDILGTAKPSPQENKAPQNHAAEWIREGENFFLIPPAMVRSDSEPRKFVHTKWLESIVKQIRPGQSYCFCLPSSFLNNGRDAELRRTLVEKGLLKTVVQLPSRIFRETRAIFSLIVLEGSGANTPLFIDASDCHRPGNRHSELIFDSEEFSNLLEAPDDPRKSIGLNTTQWSSEDFYSLNVGIHLPPQPLPDRPGTTLVQLGSIATVVAAQRANSPEQPRILDSQALNGLETLTSLPFSEVKTTQLPPGKKNRSYRLLTESAIVISSIFSNRLRACYLEAHSADALSLSLAPNLFSLRVDTTRVDPEWLLHALDTDWAREHLTRRSTGSAIQRIKMRDLLSIPILLPSLDQQADEIQEIKRERFDLLASKMGLQSQLEESQKREKLNLRAKTHTIAQQYNGLKSYISVLKETLDKFGHLDRSATPIPEDPTTLGELTDLIFSSYEKLGDLIMNLDDEILASPSEDFVLHTEVEAWVNRQNFIDVDLSYSGITEWITEDEDPDSSPLPIYGCSPRDLDIILTNLAENAIRHGFAVSPPNHPKIEVSVSYESDIDEGPFALLRVANNGTPLAPSFTLEHFTAPQIATGPTGNSGMGGWHILELVKNAGAELKISDPKTLDDQFTTGFEIKFPLI